MHIIPAPLKRRIFWGKSLNYPTKLWFFASFYSMLSCHICKHIRDKVFKSGLSKFCGRLPLKNLKGLGRPYPFNFLKAVVLHKFYVVHYWILCLICWVWETGCITSALKVHPSDFGLGVIRYVFWIWKNPSNNSCDFTFLSSQNWWVSSASQGLFHALLASGLFSVMTLPLLILCKRPFHPEIFYFKLYQKMIL